MELFLREESGHIARHATGMFNAKALPDVLWQLVQLQL
jgi:hypothetical protein